MIEGLEPDALVNPCEQAWTATSKPCGPKIALISDVSLRSLFAIMASKQYDDSGGVDKLPLNTVTSRKPITQRSIVFLRIFRTLALCSVALTLSAFLPTPWSILRTNNLNFKVPLQGVCADPASEWKDDVWPLRPQTSWDISTDFPYPRALEYDVSEGTWLRLDVHPKSGDIVFDMIGDLYCLPAAEVASQSGVTRARPVLLGVPFDSDPHFSPDGDRLVFRSDAELGIENIWVIPWKGCGAMDVRPLDGRGGGGPLEEALRTKTFEERLLLDGVKETRQRKQNRLLREGRHGGLSWSPFWRASS